METDKNFKTKRVHHSPTRVLILLAVIIIIAGCLFLGRNLGVIEPDISRVVISWQMLVIAIGVVHLFFRHFIAGLCFIGVGGFFIVPLVAQVEGDWLWRWGPVLIIFGGLLLLLKAIPFFNKKSSERRNLFLEHSYSSKDGFVVSENVFGSVQQIVLDPLFRGAKIKNVFGATALDLRQTSLEAKLETYIDIECVFGGMEIFVPNEWVVVNELKSAFGGIEDNRDVERDRLDYSHKLILRGSLAFGGIEIRN